MYRTNQDIRVLFLLQLIPVYTFPPLAAVRFANDGKIYTRIRLIENAMSPHRPEYPGKIVYAEHTGRCDRQRYADERSDSGHTIYISRCRLIGFLFVSFGVYSSV